MHQTASLDTIETNPAWVDGVRKWVKLLLRPRTYKTIADARVHVTYLQKELENLYGYLFYKVALFPRGPKGDVQWEGSATEELRHKVKDELDAAKTYLDDVTSRVEWYINSVTPGTWDYERSPSILEDLKARGGDNWDPLLVKALQVMVDDYLPKLDSILSGKMLRAFNNWTKAQGGESHARTEIALEATIGKVKMVFSGNVGANGAVDAPNHTTPDGMTDYVKYLERTQTLLSQKGLGFLWYGTIFVSCEKCGGTNGNGAKYGVGAHYVPSRDVIYVYANPNSSIPYLLAHELGHRYYFKFMTEADRARFDSYFKDVPAVSSYGGVNSHEDFAEVFAYFVTGRDMSRDQIERFKAFLAKKDRTRLARTKNACIIAAGVWDGKRSLLKNRDRNYTPKVRLVRDIINGIEVLYMEDEVTGWCEGMNEYGLGVVNSALAVGRDEKEKKFVETMGKKPKDGERILAALGCKTIDGALEKIKTHEGGLDGHTFISTPDEVVTLEQTVEHECKVTRLKGKGLHVRTNHGIVYEDAGYTEGEDKESSFERLDQAMKVLRESDGPEDLAKDLMQHRKKDREHPNNMVRDAELYTTSQMVLNLSSLELLLYIIRGKSEFKGMEDRLPKGRKPKIKFHVFEYQKDGDKIVEFDPEAAKPKKTADLAAKVAARFLDAPANPVRVAARFLDAGTTNPKGPRG